MVRDATSRCPNSDELINAVDWMKAMGYLEIWNETDTVAYPVIVSRDAEGERREPRESGR